MQKKTSKVLWESPPSNIATFVWPDFLYEYSCCLASLQQSSLTIFSEPIRLFILNFYPLVFYVYHKEKATIYIPYAKKMPMIQH